MTRTRNRDSLHKSSRYNDSGGKNSAPCFNASSTLYANTQDTGIRFLGASVRRKSGVNALTSQAEILDSTSFTALQITQLSALDAQYRQFRGEVNPSFDRPSRVLVYAQQFLYLRHIFVMTKCETFSPFSVKLN
jgi:hypothetical protein